MTIIRKIFVIASLAILAAVFLLVLFFFFSHAGSPERKVTITIPKGATVSAIAEILAQKRVIRSPLVFRLLVDYKRIDTKLMAGEYQLREGMSHQGALEALRKGPILRVYTVTVPEGLTIDQTARVVASKTEVDFNEFRELARSRTGFNYYFLPSSSTALSSLSKDNPSESLEGYLFPKTYQVLPNTDARAMINVMLRQFAKETSSLDWKSAEARGLTPFNIVTIASLIEKEARVPAERELISAVIHNRLRAGIPLQIDATVQYALPAWKKKLTYEDLRTNSTYNTYLNKGLPPGPICSPGLASLKAALAPAPVDYLYYLVTGKNGSHTFTSSYQEFLRLKSQVKNGG